MPKRELSNYWKAIIAVVAAIMITTVQAVAVAATDNKFTLQEIITIALAFLGAVLVFAKANTSSTPQPNQSVVEPGHTPGPLGDSL